MAIINNLTCPKCRETGHDTKGNHLLVFSDGGMYCGKTEYHKSGETYIKKKGEGFKLSDFKLDGSVRFDVDTFKKLEKEGKLKDDSVRYLVMSGMKEKDRYEVSNKKEKKQIQEKWDNEVSHFHDLKIKSLLTRGIRGEISKMYNVRVGLNKKGQVDRHYYPVYGLESGEVQGAVCRNLPKDFMTGRLGKMWGKIKLFGMNTQKQVSKSGARRDTITITGGALDAMSCQQMLLDSREGTKWEGQLSHIWSVTHGESGIEDVVNNIDKINKFKTIKLAFDEDKSGDDFTRKLVGILGSKCLVVKMPDGCNDPNDCLIEDREEEFVDAWWNAERPSYSSIKTLEDEELWDKATKIVDMGLSFPWDELNEITFGIRLNNLYTIGGGSGVGKTEIAKELIQHLIDVHDEKVGVIFMEEPPETTSKVIAGKWINKKLHLPPNHHPKEHEKWDEGRDYTREQMISALDALRSKKRLHIADCKGDTNIATIIAMCEHLRAIGCKYIFIDNLTTMSHEGKEGSVKAIDESMKMLGTFVMEEPVSIFLLSHLSKPDSSRKPFEEGGTVRQGDFRGSASIQFWSTFMIGVERNTQGGISERLTTYLRVVKDRLTGIGTGEVITLRGSISNGRLLQWDDKQSTKVDKKKKKTKKDNNNF